MTLTDIIAKITLFAKRAIVNDNSSSTAASISQSGSGAAVTVNQSGSGDALRITQTGSGNALVVEDSTNPDTTPFIVKSDGKVGIGTTAPDTAMEISSSVSTELRITSTNNQNPTLSLNRASALSWQIENDLGQLKIQSAGPGIDSTKTDRIFMNPGTVLGILDNVGVGIFSAASKLQVAGDITLTSSTTATTATAGAQTLPANPVGFLVVSINGTSRKIPYYAT
jgi:hypothetical protein